MSKWLKIGLLSALVFFTLGLGLLIAAVALGATWSAFTESVDAGEFSFSPIKMLHSKTESNGDKERMYYTDEDVYFLDVEFSKGVLELKETDDDRIMVEIVSDPAHAVTSELVGETLKISTKDNALRKDTHLRLYLPEDNYFEKASLKLGAAVVTADTLEADRLEVALGAGTFDGGEIESDESTWEVGVGELNLDYLDCMDVDIDCGMGCVTVALADSREDYRCDVSCAMGDVAIGNDHFSMGEHTLQGKDADGNISVDCGMGTVDVSFDEDSETSYLDDEEDWETTYLNMVDE